ncbi:MAG: carboxypeptidase regulatory-like domain-containing protein [Chloroflexi bacterium]|nr:carboxypeptidase regulatory-like domain-containing protein [Chloroflexota bacterium]
MTFEDSPKLGDATLPVRGAGNWKRRLWIPIIVIGVLLLAADGLYLAYNISPTLFTGPVGGLDGCIADASGAPVQATIWADDISRTTYEDGCFFFASLLPGAYKFRVETSSGFVYEQEIVINSGEALGLETIEVTP